MATYNGSKFLKEQLDSIRGQSRQINELVVCDDGSKDNTVNILNEFSSSAPFTVKIIVNEDNLGSTKNFEKAMAQCSGDIIISCDQDDVWLSDKVKILENVFLTNSNCGMVFTNAMMIDEKNTPLNELWAAFDFNTTSQKILKNGKGQHFFWGNNIVTGATAAISKSFFQEAAPFPKEFVHDHWLAATAALKGNLFFSDAITINYRQHSSQLLGTPSPRTIIQKANCTAGFDKAIDSMQIMLKEFNNRSFLTEKQRKMLTNKIEFYLHRKNLAPNRLIRMPKIILSLLFGNYHRFASGFLSVAKDLWVSKNINLNREISTK
jgi:glycosyltransferase involved in cell wall biosynthesis